MDYLDTYSFLPSYDKTINNIADEFYLPCMRSSVKYDRISGYFSSTIYIIAWKGLKQFIENDGKIRLICSPYITREDETALSQGYTARTDMLLSKSLKKEFDQIYNSEELRKSAQLLAYLVSANIIDVKIAVPKPSCNSTAKRLFHDKVGVFTDSIGNSVGFRGSMNETFQGLSSDGNIESIDVFPSWSDTRDKTRLVQVQESFERIWAGNETQIVVYKFPDATRSLLEVRSKGLHWEDLLKEIVTEESLADKWKPNNKIGSKTPRKHQVEALENWIINGRKGILEHATGSGKTFTAICAIKNSLDRGDIVLVLVPSTDLLNQWYKQLLSELGNSDVYYLLCGAGNTQWKEQGTLNSWLSSSEEKRIILSTMDTASSDQFLDNFKESNSCKLLLVADEVHRLGSNVRQKIFGIQATSRLGLSATPYRYGDPQGTAVIFDYFGGIVKPVFSLYDAIATNVLCRYFYYPKTISLNNAEQEEWNAISNKISQIIARDSSDTNIMSFKNNQYLQTLLINRARIIKNASGKVQLALDVIQNNYEEGQRWIVYCDNSTQLKNVLEGLLSSGYDAYEYYSNMRGDRESTLSYFNKNGGIIVSIKCLDEGVDIPSTTHALILASSKNPREFIQRRGRVLRKSANKNFAYLFDAITLPLVDSQEPSDLEKRLSIINGELSRAIAFGEMAENPACITDLKTIAIKYRIDYESIGKEGIEYEEE